ncbi:replication endonuclease [Vibrio astriarenae]|uniref:Replication endonuclease n=1 Tax=Vibrio astriarenae TaxID=1481923 RepID=A0A7Z2T507_9VIBR|nr:replication endonuclease [Vibrio astriarenae]QIA64268.1 replication endonuclease [Vibrio astriarenae]
MTCNLDLSCIPYDDRAFVVQRLSPFPETIQSILLKNYFSYKTKFQRNSYLRETVQQISNKLSIPFDELELHLSEDDLRAKALHLAKSALALRRQYLDDALSVDALRLFVIKQGIDLGKITYSIAGEVARYSDRKWWLRKLRLALRRNVETVLHHLNQVNKIRSLYCSYHTLLSRKNQKAYQKAYLENTIATNNFGQSFSLLELSQKGVADPKIRKGELMMRARGFEELSQELGHEACFLTITCPSKYHRSYSKSGQPNPKWGGFTPLDGQDYLNSIWVLIRANLNRLNIRFYGFRVAEPQHDGTPHWHLLLFVEKKDYQLMVDTMKAYAMREDGGELGATEHRFTEVKIDPSKGSATGYIAKYISKNIDGSDLDTGVYGEDPLDAAARVDAWAACWGIRQFQQLGGCSVTVWRELRRLKKSEDLNQAQEAIRVSADQGKWKEFTTLMGGVFAKRKQQVFKPYYEVTVDTSTGVVKSSPYCGEELLRALKGVVSETNKYVTRLFEWRVESCMRFGF